MVARRWGRVVHVASTAALKGYRYTAAYSASKAGLVGLMRATAAETSGSGVTVNAVCPGFVDTDIVTNAVNKIAKLTGKDTDAARADFARFSPQGRLVQPDEVASLVAYLVSDGAAAIHGQCIAQDGGETAL
jgi:NAD(P)-dependent dehydrogenase (short-subunit alcohol dehydrogenase family)